MPRTAPHHPLARPRRRAHLLAGAAVLAAGALGLAAAPALAVTPEGRDLGVDRLQAALPGGQPLGRGAGSAAVLDTGCDPEHPELRGKVAAFVDFVDPANRRALDSRTHGTSVASVIVGRTLGVAPGARVICLRVVGDRERVSDAQLLARDRAALRWVVANRDRYDIRVVNLSLGDRIGACTSVPSPLAPQLEAAFRAGVVPVMSGGNNGQRGGCGVNSYANTPNTIRVGAVFRPSDPAHALAVTPFSGRGPGRPAGAAYGQPDSPTVVAPGDLITVASALTGGRIKDSGTSFAAPFVTGTVLALRTLRPDATAAEVRDAIVGTAADRGRPGRDRAFGVGVIDPLAAAEDLVPGTLPEADRALDLPATTIHREWFTPGSGPTSRSLAVRLDAPSRIRIAAEPALRRRPAGDPRDLFTPTRLRLTTASGAPVAGVRAVPVTDPFFFGITGYGAAFLTSGARALPAGDYRLQVDVPNPRGQRAYDTIVDVQAIPR